MLGEPLHVTKLIRICLFTAGHGRRHLGFMIIAITFVHTERCDSDFRRFFHVSHKYLRNLK